MKTTLRFQYVSPDGASGGNQVIVTIEGDDEFGDILADDSGRTARLQSLADALGFAPCQAWVRNVLRRDGDTDAASYYHFATLTD